MGFTVCLCLWKEFRPASAVSWEFLCGVLLFEALTESGNTAQPASSTVVACLVLMTHWGPVMGELRLGKSWGTVKKHPTPHPHLDVFMVV